MAGTRQPTELVVVKGKKHLTKSEIEERKKKEIKAKNDKIKPPNFLSKEEKKEFKIIAKELIEIGIMSNLDIDCLSFFIKTRAEYLRITKDVEIRGPTKEVEIEKKNEKGEVISVETIVVIDDDYERLLKMQLKVLASCRKAASDLGLSIASRCRLVVPSSNKEKPKNKFSKFM
ncbi:MAG: phage terminase small subunit P27 family [Clostridium sp.]|uniref:phage terminase small subunit P27 family n=1 Tax=Clostridium sp. TaxID=1506 RepID=UPI003F3E87E7